MSFDWKSLIGGVAPTLATALGGPFAGAAVSAISEAILGKSDGTEAEITAVLKTATPDMLAKIREADQTFKVKMEELKVDLEKAKYADTDSARTMATAQLNAVVRNLSYIIVLGFFCVLCGQFIIAVHPVWEIPEAQQRTLDISFGILFTSFATVIGFHFGSSQGAIQSNKSLRKIAEG